MHLDCCERTLNPLCRGQAEETRAAEERFGGIDRLLEQDHLIIGAAGSGPSTRRSSARHRDSLAGFEDHLGFYAQIGAITQHHELVHEQRPSALDPRTQTEVLRAGTEQAGPIVRLVELVDEPRRGRCFTQQLRCLHDRGLSGAVLSDQHRESPEIEHDLVDAPHASDVELRDPVGYHRRSIPHGRGVAHP